MQLPSSSLLAISLSLKEHLLVSNYPFSRC